MDFVTELKRWKVSTIMKRLGCPERTAYAWFAEGQNRRLPPEWVQKMVLKEMKRVKPDASG